jgi:hypothetical protein
LILLQSNVVEEYTLLLCVTPPGIETLGGETRVTLNPHTALTSLATVTRGCGLLFRKDLTHEGLIVTQGSKEIVSVNIWAMRKADEAASLIHVRFCSGCSIQAGSSSNSGIHVSAVDRDSDGATEGRVVANAVLQSLADSRSYVISSSALADFPLVSCSTSRINCTRRDGVSTNFDREANPHHLFLDLRSAL